MNEFQKIKTSLIRILPDRQRKKIKDGHVDNLADSIFRLGLIHAIVVQEDPSNTNTFCVVVGECRLRAWQKLEAYPHEVGQKFRDGIPCQLLCDLDPSQALDVEFHENVKRENLSWQDEAAAYVDHWERNNEREREEWNENEDMGYKSEDDYEELSMAAGAGLIGCSEYHYRNMQAVGRKVREEDPEVMSCDSARAASALLKRRVQRVAEHELKTFGEVEKPKEVMVIGDLGVEDLIAPGPGKVVRLEPSRFGALNISFEDLVSHGAQGKKFNFVHCDFPYGKGLHESDLYNTETKDMRFEDTKEIYWDLCLQLINANKAGLLSASCHILFWFPMDEYISTVNVFKSEGFRINPYPLIWTKSDKVGIIPDAERGPRRIYETALLMSLGDRKIVKPIANACWYSSQKKSHALHVSLKPAEVLDDFLRMFIDEDSVVLDPTCGSGTALASALKLGAKYTLGCDINPDCVEHTTELCEEALVEF